MADEDANTSEISRPPASVMFRRFEKRSRRRCAMGASRRWRHPD